VVQYIIQYFKRDISFSVNIVWMSLECIFKGTTELEQLEKMDFRHSGKNGETMVSAFLSIHIKRISKDTRILFSFSPTGHPFFFFTSRGFFCTLHKNTKQKKINYFTLPVAAESIILSELFTSTHTGFNKKKPVSVYVKKFTIVQLKYSNHNYTRTPSRLFLSPFV